jgi:hypothetical protein
LDVLLSKAAVFGVTIPKEAAALAADTLR